MSSGSGYELTVLQDIHYSNRHQKGALRKNHGPPSGEKRNCHCPCSIQPSGDAWWAGWWDHSEKCTGFHRQEQEPPEAKVNLAEHTAGWSTVLQTLTLYLNMASSPDSNGTPDCHLVDYLGFLLLCKDMLTAVCVTITNTRYSQHIQSKGSLCLIVYWSQLTPWWPHGIGVYNEALCHEEAYTQSKTGHLNVLFEFTNI